VKNSLAFRRDKSPHTSIPGYGPEKDGIPAFVRAAKAIEERGLRLRTQLKSIVLNVNRVDSARTGVSDTRPCSRTSRSRVSRNRPDFRRRDETEKIDRTGGVGT